MGKDGADTRRSTPGKNPGARNGKFWLHDDKQASVSRDDFETELSTDIDNYGFSDGDHSGFTGGSKRLSGGQEAPESDVELSFDILDNPGRAPWKDNSESEEELSLDMLDAPDGIFSEDATESGEALSPDRAAAPGGIPGANPSDTDEELSLDMVAAPDGVSVEDASEFDEGLSLDMMEPPGVILSEDAYKDFLRKSESDLVSAPDMVEPVQHQGVYKNSSVSTQGSKEGAEINLPETSFQDETEPENDSIEDKGEFISFYTLGAIILLMALILLILYKT